MDAFRCVDLSVMKDHLTSLRFTAKDVPAIKNKLNVLDIPNGEDLLKELSPLGFNVDQVDAATADAPTIAVDNITKRNENKLNVLDILSDEDLLQELSSLGFIVDQDDPTTADVPTNAVDRRHDIKVKDLDILDGEDVLQELRPPEFVVNQDDTPTLAVNKTSGWNDKESYEDLYSINDRFFLWALANVNFDQLANLGCHGSCEDLQSVKDRFVLQASARKKI